MRVFGNISVGKLFAIKSQDLSLTPQRKLGTVEAQRDKSQSSCSEIERKRTVPEHCRTVSLQNTAATNRDPCLKIHMREHLPNMCPFRSVSHPQILKFKKGKKDKQATDLPQGARGRKTKPKPK